MNSAAKSETLSREFVFPLKRPSVATARPIPDEEAGELPKAYAVLKGEVEADEILELLPLESRRSRRSASSNSSIRFRSGRPEESCAVISLTPHAPDLTRL